MENKILTEEDINNNINMIYKLANRFYGVEKEDLVSAGLLGLCKAKRKFNEASNVKFSTYAYDYIFGEMYLVTQKKNIKISKDTLNLYKLIEKTRYELAQKYGYIPSNCDIASFLEIDLKIIDNAVLSGKAILSMEEGEVGDLKLEDRLEIKENISSFDKLFLNMGLDTLDPLEKSVIVERYYNDNTQEGIARKLKINQVKVSRIEKRGINKLREYMV